MVASFSMELGNGDLSVAAGIAQRYPSQNPVLLTTPSLQTNFSPISIAFWQQVYQDMAGIQNAAWPCSLLAIRRSPVVVFSGRWLRNAIL